MRFNTTLTPLLLVLSIGCASGGPSTRVTTRADASAMPTALATDVQHFTSAHLDSLAALPTESARPSQRLGDRGGYSYLLIHRTSPGEVEVHAAWDDVFVIRAGAAMLLTGDAVEGGRDTAPGERRGGRILESRNRLLRSGDVVVIPAGVAHQVVPEARGEITYLVVKASAAVR